MTVKSQRPTIARYAAHIGASQTVVKKWLANLFGSQSERPEISDFTAAYCRHIREEAAGRAPKQYESLDLDPVHQKARKDKEHADKLQLENELTRGELVLASEVDDLMAQSDLSLRTNLLGMSARVAAELVGLEEREILIRLDEEIRNTLVDTADEIEET